MKPTVIKLISLAALLAAGATAFAQKPQQNYGPEWGENLSMAEREQNVALYNNFADAYNNKQYDEALTYLPQIIERIPRAMVSTYVYARNIYSIKAQQSRALAERNQYVDSMMYMYDLRLEYFPDHSRYNRAYTLKQKATDYLLFRPTDREGLREVFDAAIEANSGTLDKDMLEFINLYFNELTTDYEQFEIEPEQYLAYYDNLSDLMSRSTDPDADTARATFDALFIKSKAGDCETIEKIFRTRLADAPGDADQLRKAFNQLRGLNCETEFFFDVAEKYFEVEPLSSTALLLATSYEKSGNSSKAMEYMRKAVDIENDPIEKARICTTIAGMELERNNAVRAADFARQAMRYNPDSGYAYMFLAQAYAIGSSACDGFDQQSVFWLATDELQKARRVAGSDQDILKNANELIALYRANFPTKDELFFRGLNSGDSHEVRCGWIRGTTTVRERP